MTTQNELNFEGVERLRSRYREICERNGWSDPIFASENFSIRTEFLENFDSLHIEVEGYLSRREMEILEACARKISLTVSYHTTPYNRKMTQRLEEMGLSLVEGKSYLLSISARSVLREEPLARNRALR